MSAHALSLPLGGCGRGIECGPGGPWVQRLFPGAKVPIPGEPRTLPEGLCTQLWAGGHRDPVPPANPMDHIRPACKAMRSSIRSSVKPTPGQIPGSRPPSRSPGTTSKCLVMQKSGWAGPGCHPAAGLPQACPSGPWRPLCSGSSCMAIQCPCAVQRGLQPQQLPPGGKLALWQMEKERESEHIASLKVC